MYCKYCRKVLFDILSMSLIKCIVELAVRIQEEIESCLYTSMLLLFS